MSKIFQWKITDILQGIKGTEVYIDGVLVHGEIEEISDRCLEQVLNRGKCKFKQWQICLLGHIFDESGVSADLETVTGIENFPQPQNISAQAIPWNGQVNGQIHPRVLYSSHTTIRTAEGEDGMGAGTHRADCLPVTEVCLHICTCTLLL